MVGIGPARTASGGNDLLIHSINSSNCTFWYSPMMARCSLMLATPCTDMAATRPTSKPKWVYLDMGGRNSFRKDGKDNGSANKEVRRQRWGVKKSLSRMMRTAMTA